MYQRILVPLDGSPTAERGLREALKLAAGQQTKLLLLHVVDDYPMLIETSSMTSYEDVVKGLRKHGLDVLASAKGECDEAAVHCEALLREVMGERVSDVIVAQAAQHACDLVVMGTHGRRGFQRLAMGSQAEAVARASPVPVLLVRSRPPDADAT